MATQTTLEEIRRQLLERYTRAAHRVQSVLAFAQGQGARIFEPKHIRVGVDMSKADQKGLADLLIKKGVFTREEYFEAVAKSAEAEADRQEAWVKQTYDLPEQVRFG